MTARTTFTEGSRPEHLADKYRVYMLRFEDGGLVMLHVGRPVSLKTFIENYIFQHTELSTQKQGADRTVFYTNQITAIEKVLNTNKPNFEITVTGQLLEIT
jgi:hypothetical protein